MTSPNTKPSYFAYVVKEGTTPKSYWTRIGAAFAHNDRKGFTLMLDALPVDGRITLRKAEPKPKGVPAPVEDIPADDGLEA